MNAASGQTPNQPAWVRDLSHPGNVVPICFFLALLVFVAFYPALTNGFVNYDDPLYVTANPHVQQGLTFSNIAWAFRSSDASNWHPLTWISHILDCELFGPKPFGHHLTSLVLHAANTILLFVWLRRFTGFAGRSLAVAILFGLHPLRVESVAWVAERKDVLSTFFWLLTLLAWTRHSEQSKIKNQKSKIFYALALIFFTLGLLSKPMVVTLPFVLLLLDYWQRRSTETKASDQSAIRNPQSTIKLLPFFLLSAAASAVTFLIQKNSGAVAVVLPLSLRLENALVSYCGYIGKLLLPMNLSVHYPYPDHLPVIEVLLCAVLLIAISAFAIIRRNDSPWLAIGWFWYLGTLVPVIGLVQVGVQSMADRYTYIPSIGLLIMLVWGVHDLTTRFSQQANALTAACALAAFLCIGLTHYQIGYWKNDEALFRHAITVTEHNWIAESDLGAALLHPGHYDEAIEHLKRSIDIYPLSANAHNDLGIALKATGHLDDAVPEYMRAIQLTPADPGPHVNLGLALAAQGHTQDAIREFQAALQIQPDFAPARRALADLAAKPNN